jgi:hypothetical protein
VFTPLKLSVPPLTFTNEPVPVPPSAIAPANVPLLSVNAVPSNATNPVVAPFNVNNVTALAPNETVPSAVTTALTGTNAPLATLNVAPLATVNAVDAKLPLPVNANVPAFTLVVPVNVFAPPKPSVPALAFTNEPVPVPPSAIAPPNVPLLSVNAVPSNATNPVVAPFNVNNVTALAPNETVPSAVTTALTGTNAPPATLNVAPLATVNAVDAKLPLPVNANVPAFTLVVPVNVFAPPKPSVPALAFTNEPVPVPPSAIAPPNVPLLSVNAVPSNLTNPVDAPFNVNNVTALADNETVPFAVTTAPTGTVASAPTLNVAPLATVNAVDAKLPLPVNANVPALTLVAPV